MATCMVIPRESFDTVIGIRRAFSSIRGEKVCVASPAFSKMALEVRRVYTTWTVWLREDRHKVDRGKNVSIAKSRMDVMEVRVIPLWKQGKQPFLWMAFLVTCLMLLPSKSNVEVGTMLSLSICFSGLRFSKKWLVRDFDCPLCSWSTSSKQEGGYLCITMEQKAHTEESERWGSSLSNLPQLVCPTRNFMKTR